MEQSEDLLLTDFLSGSVETIDNASVSENFFPESSEIHSSNGSSLALIDMIDSQIVNAKRGPGRPRKEVDPNKLPMKGQTKRTFSKESIGFEESIMFSTADIPIFTVGQEKHQEISLFVEKYPGKLCFFCNLGERSSLGQGDLLQINLTEDQMKFLNYEFAHIQKIDDDALEPALRRLKYNKLKYTAISDAINELELVGYPDLSFLSLSFEENYLYFHKMCANWSSINIENDNCSNIIPILQNSLIKKCFFCGQYGASLSCKLNCEKYFHLPCATASGCFLEHQTLLLFCSDHLQNFKSICSDITVECQLCSMTGDITKLIFCSNCGKNFHTTCIGLANLPETRAGWSCQLCNKCQICRQPEISEGRSVKCEQCQKLYHVYCLRPVITSIPKYGWKCNRCRVCSDCGSRTPGAGTSSRWHSHFTICDSCYQQRNKGFFCPICKKAYRTTAHKEMVKCNCCNRFVHGTCDNEADLSVYHKKKDKNPDYDYICPSCKIIGKNKKNDPLNVSSKTSSESSYKDTESDYSEKFCVENVIIDSNFDILKTSKKRSLSKDFQRSRYGKPLPNKTTVMSQFCKKRGSRGKNRHLLLDSVNVAGMKMSRAIDDDINIEKKIILCSSKDNFVLMQDICAMCGSIGNNEESYLISCAQCGQCYHPYCVSVKITEIVLKRGWRCLDCTVCEGCGQKNDEARLILCDECDISYHIYCMYPPLDTVPHGNWKCKWCAACQKCGQNFTSNKSFLRNGLLECASCASETVCYICNKQYKDGDQIIKCDNCKRWLHIHCDSIINKDIEIFDNVDYNCLLCRTSDKSLHSLINNNKKCYNTITCGKLKNYKSDSGETGTSLINNNLIDSKNNQKYSQTKINYCNINKGKNDINTSADENLGTNSSSSHFNGNDAQSSSETTHWIDGVYVSELGYHCIKSQIAEIKKKRNSRSVNDTCFKTAPILSNDKIISENINGNNSNEMKKEVLFKDGMQWTDLEKNPPEGFSIFVNDEGLSVLRKKRQRNLQKVGVGGFLTRNRLMKKNIECIKKKSVHTSGIEKKKNLVRKKGKPKLHETYPTYLQDAFFGRDLLCLKREDFEFYESDTSEELDFIRNNVFDYTNEKKKVLSEISENISTKEIKTETDICSPIPSNEFIALEKKEPIMHQNLNVVGKFDSEANQQFHNYTPANDLKIRNLSPNKFQKKKLLSSENLVLNTGSIHDIKDECTQLPKTTFSEHNVKSISYDKSPGNSVDSIIKYQQSTSLHKIDIESKLNLESHEQPNEYMKNASKINSSLSTEVCSEGSQLEHEKSIELVTNSIFDNKNNTLDRESSYNDTKTIKLSTEVIVAGTQKTAEKMRHDEGLGKLATISAVLYANTNYPELKDEYPNWNDRCKQILKLWRSLSTEKKNPFLQLARDNRSALRIRRTQQDKEKLSEQGKSLKMREQEKSQKKYQCKLKEEQLDDNLTNTFPSKSSHIISNAIFHFKKNEKNLLNQANSLNNVSSNDTMCNSIENQEIVKEDTNPSIGIHLTNFVNESSSIFNDCCKIQTEHPDCDDRIGEKNVLMSLNSKSKVNRGRTELLIKKQNLKVRQDSKSIEKVDVGVVSYMDADENVGLGDILGGFSEADDDDIIKSLTSETGHDFNILEYADPDLDEITINQNILSKFDLEENDKS